MAWTFSAFSAWRRVQEFGRSRGWKNIFIWKGSNQCFCSPAREIRTGLYDTAAFLIDRLSALIWFGGLFHFTGRCESVSVNYRTLNYFNQLINWYYKYSSWYYSSSNFERELELMNCKIGTIHVLQAFPFRQIKIDQNTIFFFNSPKRNKSFQFAGSMIAPHPAPPSPPTYYIFIFFTFTEVLIICETFALKRVRGVCFSFHSNTVFFLVGSVAVHRA